jgi:hypothetical protein
MTEHRKNRPPWTTVIACLLLVSAFTILAQVASAKNDVSSREHVLLQVSPTYKPGADSLSVNFDRSRLDDLPQHEFTTSTIWTVGDLSFSGPSLLDILAAADVSGSTVHLVAANGYEVRMAWEEIEETVPIVATKIDGAPFSVREKGPLWVIFPYDLDASYRTEAVYALSIWQLTDVRVSK